MPRPALVESALGMARRIRLRRTLNEKVEVAHNLLAVSEIAHRATHQVKALSVLGRQAADQSKHCILFRGEPAFHQEVIVAHGVRLPAFSRASVSGSRMMGLIYLLQPFLQYMRVNLGRGNVTVAQHQLNRSQISAPLEQVRGKRMSHQVRR